MVRVDQQHGFEERIRFVGSPGAEVFTCLHRPLGEVASALLICPPVLGDFLVNYPREVWLARALAARGVAVQRFHYRFTGNSDGHAGDLTFGSMHDDARLVLDLLLETCGAVGLTTMGTRLSSAVAVRAMRAVGEPGSMVLWEPTLDRDRYFRDAFRLASMSTTSNREVQTTPREMQARLVRDGWVDVLGFTVPHAIYDGASDTSWIQALPSVTSRVLLAQLTTGNPRSEYQALVDDLCRQGVDAEVQVCGFQEPWWLTRLKASLGREAVDISVGWAERQGLTTADVREAAR